MVIRSLQEGCVGVDLKLCTPSSVDMPSSSKDPLNESVLRASTAPPKRNVFSLPTTNQPVNMVDKGNVKVKRAIYIKTRHWEQLHKHQRHTVQPRRISSILHQHPEQQQKFQWHTEHPGIIISFFFNLFAKKMIVTHISEPCWIYNSQGKQLQMQA